jgi:hypothetical protein
LYRYITALEAAAVAVTSGGGGGGGSGSGRSPRRGASKSPRSRRAAGSLSATGDISESIQDEVYSEEFPSDESIEDEVPGIRGGAVQLSNSILP